MAPPSPELTKIGIARRSGNCSSSDVWDIGAYLAAATALLLATMVAGTADDAVELHDPVGRTEHCSAKPVAASETMRIVRMGRREGLIHGAA